jgi:hypothetical protein
MEIDVMSGSVPVVDPADMKTMWDRYQTPDAPTGMAAWRDILDNADVAAIGYRCTILQMLRSVWIGGEPSENAFKVAASMELNWPTVGAVQQGLPFNLVKRLTGLYTPGKIRLHPHRGWYQHRRGEAVSMICRSVFVTLCYPTEWGA